MPSDVIEVDVGEETTEAKSPVKKPRNQESIKEAKRLGTSGFTKQALLIRQDMTRLAFLGGCLDFQGFCHPTRELPQSFSRQVSQLQFLSQGF